jgi:hypothetical protein
MQVRILSRVPFVWSDMVLRGGGPWPVVAKERMQYLYNRIATGMPGTQGSNPPPDANLYFCSSMERAGAFEAQGCGFESYQKCHYITLSSLIGSAPLADRKLALNQEVVGSIPTSRSN